MQQLRDAHHDRSPRPDRRTEGRTGSDLADFEATLSSVAQLSQRRHRLAAYVRRRRPGANCLRLLGLALLFVLIADRAAAGWQEDLTDQLAWERDCEVDFFSNVIEREVEGILLVMVKAHCADGRVFDALQRDPFEDFELNECTAVEQAC